MTAHCEAGEHAISGGFLAPETSYASVSTVKGPRGWTASLVGYGPLKVSAYCSDGLRAETRSRTTQVDPDGGARTNVVAKCPRGTVAVAGGYETVDADNSQHDLVAFSSRRSSARAWTVSVFNGAGQPTKIKVTVHCLDDADVNVRSKQSQPIPDNSAGSAVASCDQGEQLLSGGYKTNPKPDYSNQTGPDLFYYRSSRSGRRSWTASARNYGDNVNGRITTFAYCLA